MMIRTFLLLFCSASLFLSSCGFSDKKDGAFRDRGKDYLRTGPIEKIDMPEGIESTVLEQLYPIPEVNANDEFGDEYNLVDYEIPRPVPINSDEKSLGVKILTLGDERWVYLGASTSQVWPRTQSFLANSDIGVIASDANSGLIETDWLQYVDNKDVYVRFQIRLEKGVHEETTEVHVLEAEFPVGEPLPSPMVWPEVSSDPAREEWLVRELANHLAQTIDNASASLLGQNVGGELKASFLRDRREPTMALRLSKNRAWATLTHAAKSEGFVTWEADKNKGIIFADYDPDIIKKKSFFRRLFTFDWGKDKPKPAPYKLAKVLEHLSGSENVRETFASISGADFKPALKNGRGYLIIMNKDGDQHTVVIRDHRGRKLPIVEAKERIRLLRKNLI